MINSGIVLFDGVCNLCCSLVIFIIRRDTEGRFRFAALQSSTGEKLLMNSKLSVADNNTVVYVKGDQYYYRSAAILNILFDLGGVWKMMYVFIVIPAFIRDYFYTVIAKTRYRIFGKRTSCMVPTVEIQDRFLG